MTYWYLFSVTAADKSSRSRKLKHDVIEAVNELIQDIGTCHEQIAEQAVEHIHHKYIFLLALTNNFAALLLVCIFFQILKPFCIHTWVQFPL